MGFIGDLFDPSKGAGFQASTAAHQQTLATAAEREEAYRRSQEALAQQAAFVQALQAQGAQGMGSQTALSQMLMERARGGGPSPAQAQLAQATGANVANQAALMAGQRGAGANVGMIARQAGQQGSAAQQQAINQAAILRAQEQLAAQGQLQNLAGAQIGQLGGGLSTYNQAAQAEQAQILGALGAQNAQQAQILANQNLVNAQMARGGQEFQAGVTKGLFEGLGKGAMTAAGVPAGTPAGAKGGIVSKMADGGQIEKPGPQSFVGKFFSGFSAPVVSPTMSAESAPMRQEGAEAGKGAGQAVVGIGTLAGRGLSNLVRGQSPDVAPMPQKTLGAQEFRPMASGGGIPRKPIDGEKYAKSQKMVPGKAEVKGDSYQNDKVEALLSPGEIIIPRSVVQSEDPVGNAARFVAAIMARHNLKRS